MAPFDVTFVEPIAHLRLRVGFADGLHGEVFFKESHLYGVFATLKDPLVFNKVCCAQGFVEWPGDVDLAPDAMYEAIKAHGVWMLE
jgi:hypothetical protein